MIYDKIYETIGNTPIVAIKSKENLDNLFVKLESFNPGSSVKDRIANSMINSLIAEGIVKNDTTIVEPTSGNTGIGIAMICASKGLQCILTMPESMSIERRKILKAYGATLILTKASEGMAGSITKATEIASNKNHIMLSQFENPNNPLVHKNTTAEEILKDFPEIEIFVSGIGTGGTITGIAQKLKNKKPSVKIVGVEPEASPFLTNGIKGPHKIQGIGAGFKPEILNLEMIDEIHTVTNEDALNFARKATKEDGIMLGISSGAVYKVAYDLAKKTGKKVLFLSADNGERYISTELFED